MAETRVTLIQRCEANQAWIKAAPFLLPAIEMGDEFTPDQVLSEIESGSMQLVTFENGKAYGAVVTDGVTRGNGKKVMRIIFAGGKGMSILLDDIVSTLKRAAQSSGCNAIEFIGRDGWLKTLAVYGFCKKAIFMELVL